MSEERLQKLLARSGVASRRHVEEMIREGRVTVNGRIAEIGDKADLERDAVKVDGKRILAATGDHVYLLLNKPRGVMSTAADPEGRSTVLDLVPKALRKGLVPVGRLDYMTEGLLLLTTDGEFAQHVAHPRYGCGKTYEVKVTGRPEEADLDRLRSGIYLNEKKTAPCLIEAHHVAGRAGSADHSWYRVQLSEGRSRQIREMFFRIGHSVRKLRRIGIGSLFDSELEVGALRRLSDAEVARLRRETRLPKPKGTPKPVKLPAALTGPPAKERRAAKAPAPRPAASTRSREEKAAPKVPLARAAASRRSPEARPPAAAKPAARPSRGARVAGGAAPARATRQRTASTSPSRSTLRRAGGNPGPAAPPRSRPAGRPPRSGSKPPGGKGGGGRAPRRSR
ncbi:MAG: pseudouridine synthase [Thermoanaerobaculia bacterium]